MTGGRGLMKLELTREEFLFIANMFVRDNDVDIESIKKYNREVGDIYAEQFLKRHKLWKKIISQLEVED